MGGADISDDTVLSSAHRALYTHGANAVEPSASKVLHALTARDAATDAAGTPVFVSAARTRAPQRDIHTMRMEVDGGALLWQEDLSLLLEPADWITPWTADWQEHHAVRVTLADRGYALSLRVRPATAESEKAAAAGGAATVAAEGGDAHAQAHEPRTAETEGSSWNG